MEKKIQKNRETVEQIDGFKLLCIQFVKIRSKNVNSITGAYFEFWNYIYISSSTRQGHRRVVILPEDFQTATNRATHLQKPGTTEKKNL